MRPKSERGEQLRRGFLSVFNSTLFWILLAISLAAIQAFVGRNDMNSDGLSYVDMARAALQRGPHELINGYWSPAYPALLAAAFSVARPAPALEFPVVHALNFVLFSGALFAWHYLTKPWREAGSPEAVRPRYDDWLIIPIRFALFATVALGSIGTALVTPDLGVLGSVLGTGVSLRRLYERRSWWAAAALGAVAGVGYWVKAVLFPLGAALIVILLLRPPGMARARIKVLLAGLCWMMVSAPLVLMVSRRVGHLTFSDVGALNYAFYVNGEQTFHHSNTLSIQNSATLVHPPRALATQPSAIEFDGPVTGTFPLHYAPAYWYAGLRARFELKPQLRVLSLNLRDLFHYWFVENPVIPAVLFGLWASGRRTRHRPGPAPMSTTTLALWGMSAVFLYAAVHTEPRLTAPFMLLVLLWAFVATGGTRWTRGAIVAGGVLSGSVFITAISELNHLGGELLHSSTPPYMEAAGVLDRSAIPSGAKLAMADVVGDPFDFTLLYAAHAARDSIVALIRSSRELPTPDDSGWAQLASRLVRIHVSAIVSHPPDPRLLPQRGWQFVPLSDGSKLGILRLGGNAGSEGTAGPRPIAP